MTVEVDLNNDPALHVLEKASKNVAWHYDAFVTEPDLYQAAWEWRLRHPLLTEQAMQDGTLQRIVQDHLRLLAQREKAVKSGYHVDDVEYYSPAQVAHLLPASLSIVDTLAPTGAPTDDVRGASDPHGRSGFMCSLIDVANAWINTAFRDDERQLVDARYISDLNWAETSAIYGHEVEECKRRVAVGLRRMVEFLGGWKGRSCPVACPDCTERIMEGGQGG